MITPIRLFFRRLFSEWKYQVEVIRTAIDWTVALYIVVPALIFAIAQYISWWKIPPTWIKYLPFQSIIAIMFFITWLGSFRIFLEDADQLFLYQKTTWIKKIVNLSLTYSLLTNLISTIFIFLVFAPFLVLLQLSAIKLLFLFLISLLFRYIIGLSKQLLELRLQGWARRLTLVIFFMGLSFIYNGIFSFNLNLPAYLIITLLLIVILVTIVRKRINLKGSFFEDVSRELDIKLRYVNLLLSASGINIKKPTHVGKGFLLFRSSNLIFKKRNPVNVLTETCIKSVLRNTSYLRVYGIITLFATLIILAVPLNLKWIFWIFFAFFFTFIVDLYWQELISDSFIKLFQWKKEDLLTAEKKAVLIIMLPGFIVTSSVLGFLAFSWPAMLEMIPAAIISGFFAINIITLFMAFKKES